MAPSSDPRNGSEALAGPSAAQQSSFGFFDVDDNNAVTPLDALLIINQIARQGSAGEGEGGLATLFILDQLHEGDIEFLQDELPAGLELISITDGVDDDDERRRATEGAFSGVGRLF